MKKIFKTEEFLRFEASQIESHAIGVNTTHEDGDLDQCLEELYALQNYVCDMISVLEGNKNEVKKKETFEKLKKGLMQKKAEA